jgi:hypothetical protein
LCLVDWLALCQYERQAFAPRKGIEAIVALQIPGRNPGPYRPCTMLRTDHRSVWGWPVSYFLRQADSLGDVHGAAGARPCLVAVIQGRHNQLDGWHWNPQARAQSGRYRSPHRVRMFPARDRIPSARAMSRQRGARISTILQATTCSHARRTQAAALAATHPTVKNGASRSRDAAISGRCSLTPSGQADAQVQGVHRELIVDPTVRTVERQK